MSVKLSRELAVLPVEKYRLPKDGRKWQAVARNRMMLADFLGTHGDGDGSRIFPSIRTMMRKFGWSHGKTCYLLADLRELRLLENTKNYSSPKHHRTRVRQMNVTAFLDHSGVQDRQSQESKIEQESNIQDSNIGAQESKIEVQESNAYVGHNSHSNRHLTVTTAKTPLPPAAAGEETIFEYQGTPIAVKMGRHKRLPVHHGGSMYIVYYVDFLNGKGFPARIVPKTEVMKSEAEAGESLVGKHLKRHDPEMHKKIFG